MPPPGEPAPHWEAMIVLRITDPFHGAVLNRHHGKEAAGTLRITVRGDCPPYGKVTVNGAPAAVGGGRFEASVSLMARETDLVAVYDGSYGHLEHTVRVVWDKHSFPRYRVALDDNSFFLRDIARKGYDSIFGCHYLSLLRRMHVEYGTKFTTNIYYEADDGFRITEFPETYRSEFEANADWLGLTFHAYSDKPDRPYQYASGEQLMGHLALVEEQVKRFAGEQTWITPTLIHWGMVTPDGLAALARYGVKVLSGYWEPSPWGYDVSYWTDDAKSDYLHRHDCMKDFSTGIVFSRIDIVINNTPVDQIDGHLDPLVDDPNHAEIMDLLTHEQYFWDFYTNYLPDHPERLERAIRWVTDHGYKPVFFHQGFLGAPDGG